eukprot:EG_transcript_15076
MCVVCPLCVLCCVLYCVLCCVCVGVWVCLHRRGAPPQQPPTPTWPYTAPRHRAAGGGTPRRGSPMCLRAWGLERGGDGSSTAVRGRRGCPLGWSVTTGKPNPGVAVLRVAPASWKASGTLQGVHHITASTSQQRSVSTPVYSQAKGRGSRHGIPRHGAAGRRRGPGKVCVVGGNAADWMAQRWPGQRPTTVKMGPDRRQEGRLHWPITRSHLAGRAAEVVWGCGGAWRGPGGRAAASVPPNGALTGAGWLTRLLTARGLLGRIRLRGTQGQGHPTRGRTHQKFHCVGRRSADRLIAGLSTAEAGRWNTVPRRAAAARQARRWRACRPSGMLRAAHRGGRIDVRSRGRSG